MEIKLKKIMKLNTLKRKNEILKRHTIEELRGLFAKRLDDEFFASVGAMETPISQQRKLQAESPHLLAWRGFELLTDSVYCPQN